MSQKTRKKTIEDVEMKITKRNRDVVQLVNRNSGKIKIDDVQGVDPSIEEEADLDNAIEADQIIEENPNPMITREMGGAVVLEVEVVIITVDTTKNIIIEDDNTFEVFNTYCFLSANTYNKEFFKIEYLQRVR